MSARAATLIRGDAAAAGVAAPGDRRFRRPDVRPGGRRPVGWWLARSALAIAIASGVAATVYGMSRLVLHSRLLHVSRLAIGGNTRLSDGEIDALVHGMRGQNIFEVNLDQFRQQLLGSPWVSSANLRRVLPSTIEIRIAERSPLAIARVDTRLYLVGDDGRVIDEYGPQYKEFDLPVVDGLIGNMAEGSSEAAPEAIRLTRDFLDALQSAPTLGGHVSQFDVSQAHDLVAFVDGDATAIHLGDTKFVDRLRRYYDLAPALRQRLDGIEYVDMRFDERVYVRSLAASRTKDAKARGGRAARAITTSTEKAPGR
jgi:cell division protein FtsQ